MIVVLRFTGGCVGVVVFVCVGINNRNMALFDLQAFIKNPTIGQINKCRKDDLFAIAAHYKISVVRQALKKEIKHTVLQGLFELNVLLMSGDAVDEEADGETCSLGAELAQPSTSGDEQGVGEQAAAEAEEESDAKASLPQFEPFSPVSTGSRGDARLKVRLARLQLEAQEKAQVRQAELELRLEICRLEIEAEKQIKLRQLELEAMKIAANSAAQQTPAPDPNVSPVVESSSATFDVSKHIALVPQFRESEVDSYFNAFERIALSLRWPKDVWSLLLQCRLIGKAQEVCSTLSLEDSLKYDTVKAAILRAYELVPEAYRQRFRNHRKMPNLTFVEFAREKGILFDKWCVASKVNDFSSLRELILLEEFKNCLPERVVVYLNEQKETSLSQAAVLADEFVLTHKNVFSAS